MPARSRNLISNRIRHRYRQNNSNDQGDGQKTGSWTEIGTAKVAALVGEVLPDGMVNIVAWQLPVPWYG